jgi:hypothetical protein
VPDGFARKHRELKKQQQVPLPKRIALKNIFSSNFLPFEMPLGMTLFGSITIKLTWGETAAKPAKV